MSYRVPLRLPSGATHELGPFRTRHTAVGVAARAANEDGRTTAVLGEMGDLVRRFDR